MDQYNPLALCDAAANILLLSAPGTKTKAAMSIAGFKSSDMMLERYRKRIERQKSKLETQRLTPCPDVIEVHSLSTESESTLTASSHSTQLVNQPGPDPIPRIKKTRRSSYQLQKYNANKLRVRKREDAAFVTAMGRWREESMKPKGKRVTAKSIVNNVNAMHGTNVNERSVRSYVLSNTDDVPLSGRGKKSKLHEPVLLALTSATHSYIQLSNATMTKMSDRKNIIMKIKLCVNKGPFKYTRVDNLYDRIMKRIADKIEVNSDDYKVEQRRLLWTTYMNINIWFETLKKFLIDHGFAREKDEGDVMKPL